MIKLEIRGLRLPSLNQLLAWNRMGYWSNITKIKKRITQEIWDSNDWHCEIENWKLKTRRRVIITQYRSRILDKDNAYGGAKPALDTLKKEGIIYDDRKQWCNYKVKQKKVARKDEKVIVEVI